MTVQPPQPSNGRAGSSATAGQRDAKATATWSAKVGVRRGDIVTAWERADKRGVVYLRWTSPATGRYEKTATGIRIRDAKGKVVKARVAEVIKLAEQKQAAVRVARAAASLPVAVTAPTPAATTAPVGSAPASTAQPTAESPAAAPTRGIVLAAGMKKAMEIGSGVFAKDSGHVRDTRAALARVLTVLSPTLSFDELTPQHFRDLWRELATRYKADADLITVRRREALAAGSEYTGPARPAGGRVATERAVIALVRVARWLHDGGRVKSGTIRPPTNWQKALKADWGQVTGEAVCGDDEQPRYTREEHGRLLRALAKADPRLRLAVELAGEARLGPVVRRGLRSHLNITEGAGAFALGRLRVRGEGTKPGVIIDFDEPQRAHVDEVLRSGHLSDLETLYQDGRLSDYPLFPAGRLRNGKARVDALDPMSDRTLNDLWRELEELADVPHVPGRGAYGMRRLATDLAEDVEPDERALRALFGHMASETRGRFYQQKDRVETARKTTVARRRIRELSIESAELAELARNASVGPDSGGPDGTAAGPAGGGARTGDV